MPADMNAEGARAKEKQSDELKSFQVGIELMKCVHFISAALDAATFAGSAAVVVAVIVFIVLTVAIHGLGRNTVNKALGGITPHPPSGHVWLLLLQFLPLSRFFSCIFYLDCGD